MVEIMRLQVVLFFSGSVGIELNIEIISNYKVIANYDISNYYSNYENFELNPFKNRLLTETNTCENHLSSGFDKLDKVNDYWTYTLAPSNNVLLDME